MNERISPGDKFKSKDGFFVEVRSIENGRVLYRYLSPNTGDLASVDYGDFASTFTRVQEPICLFEDEKRFKQVISDIQAEIGIIDEQIGRIEQEKKQLIKRQQDLEFQRFAFVRVLKVVGVAP